MESKASIIQRAKTRCAMQEAARDESGGREDGRNGGEDPASYSYVSVVMLDRT